MIARVQIIVWRLQASPGQSTAVDLLDGSGVTVLGVVYGLQFVGGDIGALRCD